MAAQNIQPMLLLNQGVILQVQVRDGHDGWRDSTHIYLQQILKTMRESELYYCIRRGPKYTKFSKL